MAQLVVTEFSGFLVHEWKTRTVLGPPFQGSGGHSHVGGKTSVSKGGREGQCERDKDILLVQCHETKG